ncbi:hypothetical protein NPIL_107501 [Nephila pilipes]|uniref:Uncharacterized protein n=1 Tax=Nephila pilipes TaxID=299642 RepID=A0A8X6U6F6_NEPPI|nr:hypothetical protein NPIL_107501 [Nephila pilipes]
MSIPGSNSACVTLKDEAFNYDVRTNEVNVEEFSPTKSLFHERQRQFKKLNSTRKQFYITYEKAKICIDV